MTPLAHTRWAPPQARIAKADSRYEMPTGRRPTTKGVLWEGEVVERFHDVDGLCGYYGIIHDPSGRRYIGYSSDLALRLRGHAGALARGRDHKKLQALWSSTPREDWFFVVIAMTRSHSRDEALMVRQAGEYALNDAADTSPSRRTRRVSVAARGGSDVVSLASSLDVPADVLSQWRAGVRTLPGWLTERLEYMTSSGADARRARLLAALAHTGTSQADLVRKLNLAGERTATTTVNRWCVGKVSISEAMLRYVLTTMGLPADWQPPRSDDA